MATELLGNRHPTYSNISQGDTERGDAAVDFARAIGMTLYPWQEDVLRDMCRTKEVETPTRTLTRFAARQCVIVIPRQNGKNEILIARELAGIFLFGEKVILHTAQLTTTATAAMRRTQEIIENNADLLEWWSDTHNGNVRFSRTNGKEEIIFPNGATLKFGTRSATTGRGLTVDLLVVDEALDFSHGQSASLSSTTMAVDDAQTIYTSSPVDMYENPEGKIFSDLRWQGRDGADGLFYVEWSAEEDDDIFAQETWQKANPSLATSGFGVQIAQIKQNAEASKHSESARRAFEVENLGLGKWYPRDTDEDESEALFDSETVERMLTDEQVQITRPVVAVDAHPDRENIAVSIAGTRKDDNGYHIHTAYFKEFDIEKAAAAVAKIIDTIDPEMIVFDKKNPAGQLLAPKLEHADLDVTYLGYERVQSAALLLMQLADEERISVSRNAISEKALRDIKLRQTANAVALERYSGDVAGIVAGALATYVSANLLEKQPVIKKKTIARNAAVKSPRGGAARWQNNRNHRTPPRM